MTNYEWLVKNNAELVKEVLAPNIGVTKRIVKPCLDTLCCDCEFIDSLEACPANVKKWFEREHEPLYKKGDIVIDLYGKIVLIAEDDCGEDVIKISRYVNDLEHHQYIIPITEIKKKVGHIESEV